MKKEKKESDNSTTVWIGAIGSLRLLFMTVTMFALINNWPDVMWHESGLVNKVQLQEWPLHIQQYYSWKNKKERWKKDWRVMRISLAALPSLRVVLFSHAFSRKCFKGIYYLNITLQGNKSLLQIMYVFI